jgi:hypothetical protein
MNLMYVLAEIIYWFVHRDLVRRLEEKTHRNKAKNQKEQGKWGCVLPTRKLLCTRHVFLACDLDQKNINCGICKIFLYESTHVRET